MAKYLLRNDVMFTGVKLRSGKVIDSASFDVAALEANGALLAPLDPLTQAVADQLAKLYARGASLLDPGMPLGVDTGLVSDTTAAALEQTAWYILPGGDDSADGTTSATALATHAQLAQRYGKDPKLAVGVTVNVPEGFADPDADPIRFDGELTLLAGGSLTYVLGVQEVLLEGSFTDSVVAQSAATNTFWEVTDSALAGADDWEDYEFNRIRNTTQGLIASVAKSIGSKTAQTSNWVAVSAFPDAFVDPGTPDVGDDYVVEKLFPVTVDGLKVRGSSDIFSVTTAVSFVDADLNGPDGNPVVMDVQGADLRLYGCTVGVETGCPIIVDHVGFCVPLATTFHDVITGVSGTGGFWPQAGLASFLLVEANGYSVPDGDFIVRGDIVVFGKIDGSKFGCLDGGVVIGKGGVVSVAGGGFGFGRVWGQGGGNCGLGITDGKALIGGFNPNNGFVITGDSGDFSLGTLGDGSPGNSTGAPFGPDPQAFYFDASNGYVGPVDCTWVNFAAVQGSGAPPTDGFGKAAVNPATQAKICTQFF